VTVADALMLALGVIAVGSGALVVTSTHLVRAGLYLVISLGANAGLYLVLGAEMVAWVQILVYVGAVVVLLLFAVMLTRAPIGPSKDLDRPAAPAALIGAGVGFGLAALLVDAFRWTEFDLPEPGTAQRVGEQVFGAWVLPFEVLSILLLAALVGAIVLSRPDLGARPDPDAASHPVVPPPDPADESAEVVARLERIAARQAAAQARVRQAHAEQLAAEARAEMGLPDPEPEPADPLRDRAREVIFGAHQARPRIGVPDPIEPDPAAPRVIEGTSRPAVVEEGDKAVGGAPRRPAVGGRTDRPALPSGPAPDQDEDGEK
jgi:NADH:ubiquinone oxidoreductase subunit 6 (subunit J)